MPQMRELEELRMAQMSDDALEVLSYGGGPTLITQGTATNPCVCPTD